MSKYITVFVFFSLFLTGCKSTSHSLFVTAEVSTERMMPLVVAPDVQAVIVFHHDKIATALLESDED
ncbi:MAG: hypothetical protein ABL890_04835 [Candidatus Peribacteraceae bacterium]